MVRDGGSEDTERPAERKEGLFHRRRYLRRAGRRPAQHPMHGPPAAGAAGVQRGDRGTAGEDPEDPVSAVHGGCGVITSSVSLTADTFPSRGRLFAGVV